MAGLYDALSGEGLGLHAGSGGQAVVDSIWIGERPPVPEPQHRLEAEWAEPIRLHGFDLAPAPGSALTAGEALTVTLHWQAVDEIDEDYTVFVHLVDEQGEIRGQSDSPPLNGGYPTSYWHIGERIRDQHQVPLDPQAPAGEYRVLVGLYTPENGARLAVSEGPMSGSDSVLLTQLRVR